MLGSFIDKIHHMHRLDIVNTITMVFYVCSHYRCYLYVALMTYIEELMKLWLSNKG